MRLWSAFECGIPAIDNAVASTAGIGRCTLCGGDLDSHVIPWHRAAYPGQVEHRCTVCGTIETPAMRGQAPEPVLGGPRHRLCLARVPHVAPAPVGVMVPCARSGCRKRFLFVPGSPGRPREHCSRSCGDRDRYERRVRRA